MEGEGRTTSLVAVDGVYAGALAFADPIKANAAQAVATLRSLGVRAIMASGDSERSALATAGPLGIASPPRIASEEKLALVPTCKDRPARGRRRRRHQRTGRAGAGGHPASR